MRGAGGWSSKAAPLCDDACVRVCAQASLRSSVQALVLPTCVLFSCRSAFAHLSVHLGRAGPTVHTCVGIEGASAGSNGMGAVLRCSR